MKNIFLLSLVYCFQVSMAQDVIKLYPTKIPNEIAGPDIESTDVNGRISNISRPTLTIYLPSKEKANGTAVIICPGGGYGINASIHEGIEVAKQFSKAGVAAFILKYRLPSDKIMPDKTIGPLQDAQQAIKTVRLRAQEWNVDPTKIGILGFSAGGHLASTLGTHFQKSLIDNTENVSLRPDFMILLYPVISLADSLTHMGSRNNLIGKSPSPELIKAYSNDLQVTNNTPPSFIVHAGDDGGVKVENSLQFYTALKRHSVPAELLIYPKGGHGFGLINKTTPDRWLDRCFDWMKSNGWL
jgi:acetyl esterase/lipase